jgi:hypothetical protein
MPGALDSHGQTSLVLATRTSFVTRLDLATICQKVAKKIYLLVINDVDSIYAQKASLAARRCEFRTLPPPLRTSSCFSPSTCQNYLLSKFRKEYH